MLQTLAKTYTPGGEGSLRAGRNGNPMSRKPLAGMLAVLRVYVSRKRCGEKSRLEHSRGGFGAEAGYDEADFFVGDFGREGFLEGLQAVHS
jgi:hypothetical protein